MISTKLLFTIFVIVASVAVGDNDRHLRRLTGGSGGTGGSGEDGGLLEFVDCVDSSDPDVKGATTTFEECDEDSDFGADMCCRLFGPPYSLTYDPESDFPQLPCVCNSATNSTSPRQTTPAPVVVPIPAPAPTPAAPGDCDAAYASRGGCMSSAGNCGTGTADCCWKFICECVVPDPTLTAGWTSTDECVP